MMLEKMRMHFFSDLKNWVILSVLFCCLTANFDNATADEVTDKIFLEQQIEDFERELSNVRGRYLCSTLDLSESMFESIEDGVENGEVTHTLMALNLTKHCHDGGGDLETLQFQLTRKFYDDPSYFHSLVHQAGMGNDDLYRIAMFTGWVYVDEFEAEAREMCRRISIIQGSSLSDSADGAMLIYRMTAAFETHLRVFQLERPGEERQLCQ